ncbi:hypothetical protein [Rhodopirellula baltica]|uniref:Uncharacterized protein n=1 Tax=Rhodopirellula baltica SWK14 TaxID=993516 RepID=L7CIA3_RHOBT|nr:hypothetical protein [Rhodopirellula baltica]ELP33362.1 hypothetical protein RBSWK_02697 [Rhodopirellula baltica SWK14]
MADLRDSSIPLPLRWILAHGITSLTPWYFLDDAERIEGLRNQYRREVSGGSQPISDCLPFARRQDNDDVAAFAIVDNVVTAEVIDVHLTWATDPERPGFPRLERYPDFWTWFKSAVDASADWATEDDLDDVISDGPVV